jgi:hypothetical protein
MIKSALTNSDRMLQVVLSDIKLVTYGEYNPTDYETIDDALTSESTIVVAVAKMILGLERRLSEKEIYNEVNNYLRNNLI